MVGQLSGRVLLVDDEPLVRKFISGSLVAAGYIVRVAVDGLDAIGKLRDGPPALIISDLKMPRMSGFELLDVVRKRFPQIPVIVISGAAGDQMPEGVAADAYCQKNEFLSEQLLQTMGDLTRKPPPRTALPHVDIKPVQAIWDKDANYVICCEDCLRTFSVPSARSMRGDEKCTMCVHCGKIVHFLVAEGDPEGPARP
jgi:CheY-like chemotaxis protein